MKNSTNLFQKNTSSNTLELLSKDEKTKFRECEKVIEKGWNTFVGVGKALTDIRDKRLYRQEFRTFESYCRQRWSFGKAHAYRHIGAAEVIEDLSPIGDKLPVAESQVRPLISVPREKRAEAWEKVIQSVEGAPITAKNVEAIAQTYSNKKAQTKKRVTPKDWAKIKHTLMITMNAAEENDMETTRSNLKKLANVLRVLMPI